MLRQKVMNAVAVTKPEGDRNGCGGGVLSVWGKGAQRRYRTGRRGDRLRPQRESRGRSEARSWELTPGWEGRRRPPARLERLTAYVAGPPQERRAK